MKALIRIMMDWAIFLKYQKYQFSTPWEIQILLIRLIL